ncbi:hypothetical protein [Methylorubrum thiocyanatum]|uniref:hypothetical protein n=1 Tax=Methylorubrum thiocyanatum TaxID=47958 RepID=UPI0015FD643C|nr:hypothetical protein [Methylorubrum thiocyanatum]
MTESVGRDELTPVDLQVAPVDSINDLAPYTLRGIRMRKAKPGAQQPAAEVDVLPSRSKDGRSRTGQVFACRRFGYAPHADFHSCAAAGLLLIRGRT